MIVSSCYSIRTDRLVHLFGVGSFLIVASAQVYLKKILFHIFFQELVWFPYLGGVCFTFCAPHFQKWECLFHFLCSIQSHFLHTMTVFPLIFVFYLFFLSYCIASVFHTMLTKNVGLYFISDFKWNAFNILSVNRKFAMVLLLLLFVKTIYQVKRSSLLFLVC